MKYLRKNFDYVLVFKHFTLTVIFMFFNCLENQILPYSTAIFTTALLLGSSLLITPLCFLLSFVLLGDVGLLGANGIFILVITPISLIYKKFNMKSFFEFALFNFVGMLGFIFIGSSTTFINLEKRILTSILSTFICFLSIIAGKSIKEKGFKFKLDFEDFFSVSIMMGVLGLGVCNMLSPFVFKGICIFLILFSCYSLSSGLGCIFSAVFGLTLSVYYNNLNYVSVFILYGVFSASLLTVSRYMSALLVLACDYLLQVVFSIYQSYTTAHFVCVLFGVLAFSVFPTQYLNNFKDKISSFKEKQLVRQTINRNRTILSNKLYDVSNVFAEMANSFNLFKKQNLSEDSTKIIIEKEISTCVCRNCDNFDKCKKNERAINLSIAKMIDIGFAKGKLSLIDLPTELSKTCIHPNNILFAINKLLADYRARLIENANLEIGRDLIAKEAFGISEVIRSLALESGQLLKFHNKLEKALYENLFKAGFLVTELLLYGEDDRLSASIIFSMNEFSLIELQNVVSKTLNTQMEIETRSQVNEQKTYVLLKKANEYEAVFGIAKAIKDGSLKSGDTHAMTKISSDKVLVALSDGMGSGLDAENVSSTSLSLIESFYKAGLDHGLILDTVNKLLSINTEDFFTALDISVIDLKKCSADFIKYGAPYGFIVNENGIKIVEGSSLPLGIIDGLKPSIATTPLTDGDMVVLLTDGISDAFNNSGAIIDFLRTLPAKNPQTLAEEILNKAISLNDNQVKDDMTALAVRVFKKQKVV